MARRKACDGEAWIVWDQTETAKPVLVNSLEEALKMIAYGGYIECDKCGEILE